MTTTTFDLRIVLDGHIESANQTAKLTPDQAADELALVVPHLGRRAWKLVDKVMVITKTGLMPVYDIALTTSSGVVGEGFRRAEITQLHQRQRVRGV